MFRNFGLRYSFSFSLLLTLLLHLVALLFIKKNSLPEQFNRSSFLSSRPIKIDNIQFIKPEDVPQLKKVGVKDGAKKDYFEPDMIKIPKPSPMQKKGLSLDSLAPQLPPPTKGPRKKEESTHSTPLEKNTSLNEGIKISSNAPDDNGGHFYFNPKKEKKITQNREQDTLKQEAYRNITTSATNPVAQKISNFEIRYERPEGVSEDQLNSDEKAYYSFFKRSYASYLSKLYATYDRVSVERPGIDKDFEGKHLLIGRIDYDDKGNIILVKILKSSDSDNIHYFFEETLKQLNLPNPPKSFTKNKKQFSTYYQIQIN